MRAWSGTLAKVSSSQGRRSSRLRFVAGCLLLAALALTAGAASEALRLGWDAPDESGLPPGWVPLEFDKIKQHTQYRVLAQDGAVVVRAEAVAAASGLIRKLDLEPREYRLLRWRWKVENLIDRADITRKRGDDYPARIYVAFAYDPAKAGIGQRLRYEAARLIYGEYPPHAALSYVWDGKAPAGTMLPNAYTDRAHMIVVDSGPGRVGEWVTHERDMYQDYRRAFGQDPPRIAGIAIMTDTDDTKASAVAYYGEISVAPGTR